MTFAWDETDLISFFEVLPLHEDVECGPGPQLTFDVSRNGMRMVLAISPLMSDLTFELYVGDAKSPVFQAVYLSSPGFRIVNEKDTAFLEIGAPGSINGKYDGAQPFSSGIRVHKEPALFVRAFVT